MLILPYCDLSWLFCGVHSLEGNFNTPSLENMSRFWKQLNLGVNLSSTTPWLHDLKVVDSLL